MKNTITVTIPFSFKGKEYKPSIKLDLDAYIKNSSSFDFLFHQLAAENQIDNYSYEYEVLESSPMFFSEATGIAEEFLSNDHFDLQGFIKKQSQKEKQKILNLIAKETLDIENLEAHESLNMALLKAYQAGASSSNNDN